MVHKSLRTANPHSHTTSLLPSQMGLGGEEKPIDECSRRGGYEGIGGPDSNRRAASVDDDSTPVILRRSSPGREDEG